METVLSKPKIRVKDVRGRQKESPDKGKKKRAAKKKEDPEDDLPAPEVRFGKALS